MPVRLHHIVVDAHDLPGLARFWTQALGWQVLSVREREIVIGPDENAPVGMCFMPVTDPKTVKNRVHLDLTSSAQDRDQEIERLLALGARRVDIGQTGEESWTVLADPEGNEFCVLDPRPVYFGIGPVAAVVADCRDPAAVAGFWKLATGWVPGDSIAFLSAGSVSLRSPAGVGPYLELLASADAKTVKNRIHLDVAPEPGEDQAAAVAALRAAGAAPVDIGQGSGSWIVLADPEGSEFCLLSPR